MQPNPKFDQIVMNVLYTYHLQAGFVLDYDEDAYYLLRNGYCQASWKAGDLNPGVIRLCADKIILNSGGAIPFVAALRRWPYALS